MKGRQGIKSLLFDSAEFKYIGPTKQNKLSASIFKPGWPWKSMENNESEFSQDLFKT